MYEVQIVYVPNTKGNWQQMNNKIKDAFTSDFANNVQLSEIKLYGPLATNNLLFLLIDTIFPDSQIVKLALKRSKITKILKDCLVKIFLLSDNRINHRWFCDKTMC